MKKTIFLFAVGFFACTIAMAQTGKKAKPAKPAAAVSAEKKQMDAQQATEAAKLKATHRKLVTTGASESLIPVKE